MLKRAFGVGLSLILFSLYMFSGVRISSDGIRLSKNFYEVDPGKLYRSAQLTGGEFHDVIQKYGIKSVINLQGDRPGTSWYEDEIATMKELGVNHVSISMATENIPRRENLVKLLEAYKNLPRPILIHCRSGADRAGEASAIYVMEYMGKTKEEAAKMLDIKFLHVETFVPSKKYFINLYQGEKWAKENYNHCSGSYKYADLRGCPESRTPASSL